MSRAGAFAALACLLAAGCRDYDRLNRTDDLGVPAEDLSGPRDLATRTDASAPPDLMPACKLYVYDRDAGTPGAPDAAWFGTEAVIAAVYPGTPVASPNRLSTGDADGDSRPDVVTMQTGPQGTAQLAYFRGATTAGAPDLVPVWTIVPAQGVNVLLLADFIVDERPAIAPRAELFVIEDGVANGTVAAPPYATKVAMGRVTTAGVTPMMGTFDLASVPALAPSTFPVSRVVSAAAADLDRDGAVDLVFGINHAGPGAGPPFPAGGLLVVWGGGATASLGSSGIVVDWSNATTSYVDGLPAHPGQLIISDIDGDCFPEVIAAGIDVNAGGAKVQLVRVGIGGPRTLALGPSILLASYNPDRMVALDLDRDGVRSLILTDTISDWRVLKPRGGSLGATTFDMRTLSANPSGSMSCVVGDSSCITGMSGPVVADFDGDGAEDLIHWGYFIEQGPTYTSALFDRNDSLGNLVRTPVLGIVKRARNNRITDVAAVDIDGDGRKELVFVDDYETAVMLDRLAP